ncbi:IAA-alanine resistance protein 1 isoform X1 [Raphanus sativus]|uniref:IAA-alanine resistance protein 1 isoform X1 n=1 Tax=Raphanus sativus TaxID=3726 RepID=A0A6J0KY37_RAPSA|nr:IAA-alanine resistance protein 1 isoform X1 [Raphanus sativus]
MKLPEELAEEEDLRLCGFGPCLHNDHDHESNSTLSGFAPWVNALGCSLLVSLASLICLILLPLMFVQGKPAKWFVDALALFGGAMSGDAFLHQLPHAFGGGHSHSHDHHESHGHHDHSHSDSPSHSHSIQDLSVGLSVLAGIVDFLLVIGDEVLTWQQQKSVKKSDLAPAGRKEDSVMLVKSQRVI